MILFIPLIIKLNLSYIPCLEIFLIIKKRKEFQKEKYKDNKEYNKQNITSHILYLRTNLESMHFMIKIKYFVIRVVAVNGNLLPEIKETLK